MSRKHSLLQLDRRLDALMLFVYCKMLLSSDICITLCLPALISPEIDQSLCYKLPGRFLFSPHKCLRFSALEVCTIPAGADRYWYFTGCLRCKQHCSKPLTHPLLRCSGSETGVWSSTVNHRSDFAYLEDAVTCANITTLCLSFFPAPLPLPHTYQLLRSVLILSLPCLYLAVHTKPKPACPHSINGISQLFQLFFHMSVLLFSPLHLSQADWSFAHHNLVCLDSSENTKRQTEINLS